MKPILLARPHNSKIPKKTPYKKARQGPIMWEIAKQQQGIERAGLDENPIFDKARGWPAEWGQRSCDSPEKKPLSSSPKAVCHYAPCFIVETQNGKTTAVVCGIKSEMPGVTLRLRWQKVSSIGNELQRLGWTPQFAAQVWLTTRSQEALNESQTNTKSCGLFQKNENNSTFCHCLGAQWNWQKRTVVQLFIQRCLMHVWKTKGCRCVPDKTYYNTWWRLSLRETYSTAPRPHSHAKLHFGGGTVGQRATAAVTISQQQTSRPSPCQFFGTRNWL